MSQEFALAIGRLIEVADLAIPENLDDWLDVLDCIAEILIVHAKDCDASYSAGYGV